MSAPSKIWLLQDATLFIYILLFSFRDTRSTQIRLSYYEKFQKFLRENVQFGFNLNSYMDGQTNRAPYYRVSLNQMQVESTSFLQVDILCTILFLQDR